METGSRAAYVSGFSTVKVQELAKLRSEQDRVPAGTIVSPALAAGLSNRVDAVYGLSAGAADAAAVPLAAAMLDTQPELLDMSRVAHRVQVPSGTIVSVLFQNQVALLPVGCCVAFA